MDVVQDWIDVERCNCPQNSQYEKAVYALVSGESSVEVVHLSMPARAEAFYSAARLCRASWLYAQGYEIARHAIALKAPRGLCLLPIVSPTDPCFTPGPHKPASRSH